MMNLAKLRALRERLNAEREGMSPKRELAEELTPKEQIMRKAIAAYGGGPDRGDVGALEPRDVEASFWHRHRRVKS